MYIIADSGSTKTEWCIIDREKNRRIFITSGINPIHLSKDDISILLKKEWTCSKENIRRVFFYGAGCAFEEKNKYVQEALAAFFNISGVEIASDLLAAARSLCKDEPGICCILGTGSNSCYYDGQKIVENVPPLGYILGDEGSGAVLGKKLLGNILKGLYPEEIRMLFSKEYGYTYEQLIHRIYKEPLPNRFLASLTEFVYKYIHHPEMEELVCSSFDEFIERNVLQYKEALLYPVHFTGSTAFYFKDLLAIRLKKYGLRPGNISKAPMEGLVEYHETSIIL